MFHNANVGCRETDQLLSPSAHCTTEIYPQNAQGTGLIHAKQSQESTSDWFVHANHYLFHIRVCVCQLGAGVGTGRDGIKGR